jgi:hypothetical protein
MKGKSMKLLLIFIFVIIFVVLFYQFSSFTDSKKFTFLQLVLYSDDPSYNCMYNVTSEYYKQFTNVKTVYYAFSEHINDEYEFINDILYIKGKETYVPGITEKTIKSIEYFKDYPFDYLVRSNISTIVNFDVLNKNLRKKRIEYGGSLNNLQWIDTASGIMDETYFGTVYVSGISIVLSKKAVNELLINKKYLNYNVIDDVCIGLLFKEHTHIVPKETGIVSTNGIFHKNTTFYRNRTENRESDCIQMKKIIDKIK